MKTIEPTEFTQGERVAWSRSIDDYPASLYTLEYRFRPQAGNGFNVTATTDGDDFAVEITAAVSSAIPDAALGSVAWQSWLTEIADTDNTFICGSGTVTVKRGFGSTSLAAVDLRSVAKQTLDAINAAIKGQATANQQEYEITTTTGSRKIKRCSLQELLAARKEFAAIVANENTRDRMKNGGPFMQQVKVRVYEQ